MFYCGNYYGYEFKYGSGYMTYDVKEDNHIIAVIEFKDNIVRMTHTNGRVVYESPYNKYTDTIEYHCETAAKDLRRYTGKRRSGEMNYRGYDIKIALDQKGVLAYYVKHDGIVLATIVYSKSGKVRMTKRCSGEILYNEEYNYEDGFVTHSEVMHHNIEAAERLYEHIEERNKRTFDAPQVIEMNFSGNDVPKVYIDKQEIKNLVSAKFESEGDSVDEINVTLKICVRNPDFKLKAWQL